MTALPLLLTLGLAADRPAAPPAHAPADAMDDSSSDYLPTGEATAYLTVERGGAPARQIVVLTERVAVNETGPKETVARFGETYQFSPNFFAVHAGEPVEISFWNLQPDDLHRVMFVAPDHSVLMHWRLPALTKLTFTYTFHKPGLYDFVCTMHAAQMAGQILVL